MPILHSYDRRDKSRPDAHLRPAPGEPGTLLDSLRAHHIVPSQSPRRRPGHYRDGRNTEARLVDLAWAFHRLREALA